MNTKRTLFTAITLCVILTSASAFLANDFSNAITKMIEKIRAIRMTGDPDSYFSNVMSEHNQGAIDLANVELKSGKDAAVIAIAKKVLAAQQKEQETVKKHVKTKKVARVSSTAPEATNMNSIEDNVKDVVADIEKWMKKNAMTGDADKDFVAAMVEHYKNEVKLANIEMRHGKDQKVKDLATKVKNDAMAIEKELNDWKNGHSK
jgi:uncharacterized protein (DUF305 family)